LPRRQSKFALEETPSALLPRLIDGPDHPVGRGLIGEATISALEREALRVFHARWFHPNNATLIVTGTPHSRKSAPKSKRHIGAPINTALIMEHRDELLRLAASIMTRTVAPSTILKWCSSSKSSDLAKALRELGRIERTMFMIEWYSSPALRRRCQAVLNNGEAAHKLKRAFFSMSAAKSVTAPSIARRSVPPG